MNHSIEQMRQRAREIEERSRQQQAEYRRQAERQRDRQDEERRHRERLGAARGSSGASFSGPAPSMSLKGTLWLFVIAGALFALAALANLLSNEKETPSHPATIDTPALAGEELQHFGHEGAVQAASAGLESPRSGNEARADESPLSDEPSSTPVADRPEETDVDEAILRALDSGSAVAWESGGMRGYASVSAPINLSDRICRTVAISGTGDASGNAQSWCRTPNGAWALVQSRD